MRLLWTVVSMSLALLGTAGPAHADPAVTARTDDGQGVRLGAADAPVQLAIFCEPQCPVCAAFEGESGDRLVEGLASHRLAVTYRWLTFLDERRGTDTSARLAGALMTAADPATAPVAYQNFVAQLYRQPGDGNPAAVAAIARAAGIPGPIADRIAAVDPAGEPGMDTAAMAAANRRRLVGIDPQNPGTPTVYDLNTNTVVDTDEPGWLERLMPTG